ncbi:MAG TPA: hypothetical protein VE344_12125 [Methylomirabilota bacterium]|nr:hypothetical protein [Methylomirabilota bacterium]
MKLLKMVGSARCADRTPQRGIPTFLIVTAVLFLFAMKIFAQQTPTGHATDFTSVEYYTAPNQMRMKSRLSGAEAQPMEGGSLLIKQLKLEMFATNGTPQVIVNAPECVYNSANGTANSSGKLLLQNGDGKIRIEGEGFLWRQTDEFLTISNSVRTTIESDQKMAP